MRPDLYRVGIHSDLGEFAILWRDGTDGPRVVRVLLPGEPGRKRRSPAPGGAAAPSDPDIEALADRMRRFLAGEPAYLPASLIDLGQCSGFQRRTLLAEYGIPRGRVSTYGRIAAGMGAPGAARAVGTALARNPFPIIIPCHRTVRADGHPGGFRGGASLKRALLELEGVEFTPAGRVAPRFIC